MKITLNEQEIIRALTVYMALKGFKAGNTFVFRADRYSGVKAVEFDVRPDSYNIEDIKKYANQ